jgi:hypothetical protein
MRGLVRGLGPALVLAGAIAVMPAAAQARVRVSMKPGSGRPTTIFAVSFRSPDRTGRLGSVQRTDVLSAGGPKPKAGCVAELSMNLPATRQGRRVRVRLKPRRFGGSWCVGRFHGSVVEHMNSICLQGPAHACPLVVIAPRTIARFSFVVKPPPGATGGGGPTQTQGPTFAGLQSAATCIVLTAQVQPRARSYRLAWTAATDPMTPSSQIVYDVYYSTTSGGEDFAHPTWTSPAGATNLTVAVEQPGAAYFIVRARDQAGVEDQNKVERTGVNQCG